MIKTVVVSETRMRSIENQYSYALTILANMEWNRISLFLKEIESKNIYEISFHGVKPGTNKSEEDIFLRVNWDKHDELIKKGEKFIYIDDSFKDGAAPETNVECQLFKKRCQERGLNIEWRVRYVNSITNNPSARASLNSKLGLVVTKPSDQIILSSGSALKYEVELWSIQEMSIGVSSD